MTSCSTASAGLLLLVGLACTNCQADQAPAAADLISPNPTVAAQAQKVQQLTQQLREQEGVIETEKSKLDAMQQQLAGAQQNLAGLKKEAQAAL